MELQLKITASNTVCTPSSPSSHPRYSTTVTSKMARIWPRKHQLSGINATSMAHTDSSTLKGLSKRGGLRHTTLQRIGVISMYKEQVGELKRGFTKQYGEDILQKIE
jgi:hypothetical protein